MSLVSTGELVARAVAGRRAVPAFNVITLEYAEAVTAGAEAAGSPVILQISENAVRFHGGRVEPLARAAAGVARTSRTDVALHLDHVTDVRLLHEAADAGFSSVMFDAGALPYADNLAATLAAARWAHGAGLWLEAELGYVGGKPGAPASAHAAGVRTDPDEAARFVADTGVDALAVAVGSSHAMTERSASLDHGLIERLRDAVPVPLVLHGSSGVGDDDLRAAVTAGVAKVNIGTALGIAFTRAVRDALQARPDTADPRHYLDRGRAAVAQTVRELCSVVAL
ncbi:class II fructose-bisphosphate aldolase family protein [Streptomyces cocklensis]|jgi:fructose-bisphosphate aldolase class II|uniref:Tagatose 1,6-diphosphate aldolase n=1 Tax=Actinacidiphila cocklensis TaxID=887465 RepID=A0A9W4DZT8_9ACTN|nr:class II fructose-bisphosphate aldolase [Actinacidiphila cocklensis]MDD1058503.1 class II fructose-bisphosphate aldolase family protein [Actinacidiphila cocklensis]WSX75290.1 class II fructose-bisphosphate aldolase family protein [Streptomyces sp. NBC_00899]CAG6390663.1 Tagatose 1,6-diphosphate aldolase [Actinacidiphila cocklensis]